MGSFTFTVKATNGGGDATQELTIVINQKPEITTGSLATGKVGAAYSQKLAATGNTPITWTIESGSLPAGLTLTGDTISGTPTAAGTFNITVKAENDYGTATKAYTLTVSNEDIPVITTTSLPAGLVGTAYSQTLAADSVCLLYTSPSPRDS